MQTTKDDGTQNIIDILSDVYNVRTTLQKAKLIRPIVPIQDWIISEYYVGPDAKSIYPFWRNHICNIFDSNRKPEDYISEVIITGGLGTGKTTIADIIFMRKLYELSCYDHMQTLFNLMTTAKIAWIYFNLTKEQAELTGYGQLRSLIDSSPYFREHFPRNDKKSTDIEWPDKNMYITYGSSLGHMIGTNLLGSIMDEANFYQGANVSSTNAAEVQGKAAVLYNNILRRRRKPFYVWRNKSLSINTCIIKFV